MNANTVAADWKQKCERAESALREVREALKQSQSLLWDLNFNVSNENGHYLELRDKITNQRKLNAAALKSGESGGED